MTKLALLSVLSIAFIVIAVSCSGDHSNPGETAGDATADDSKIGGFPEILVCFDDYCGPDSATDCSAGVCTLARHLDFGMLGAGEETVKHLTISNRASCALPSGVNSCASPHLCSLTIAPDSRHENVGLGFEPGTNDNGHFQAVGSWAVPIELRRPAYDGCEDGATDSISLGIRYTAPLFIAPDQATMVIESNDPYASMVKVNLVAN
jgi:hypothetical protein